MDFPVIVPRLSRQILMMLALVAVGVGLRVYQYVAAGSMWLDEIGVSRGILERSATELVSKPLPLDQVAPLGFVLAQKGVTALFGTSDFAWRVVPLAGAILALLLIWRLAERTLDGIGPFVAVALFGTAVPLVFYATQAKQYSTDLLASIVVLSCAERLDAGGMSRRSLTICALLGAAMVWLSQPAMLVIAAAGAMLLVRAWWMRDSQRGDWRWTAGIVAIWAVSTIAAALDASSRVSPELQSSMREFWSVGLPPSSWSAWWSTRWPVDQMLGLLGGYGRAQLGYPKPAVYAALGLVGFAHLFWRGCWLAHTATAVALVALGASLARQYPLTDRLALYLVPMGMLLIAAGVNAVWVWIGRWNLAIASTIALVLVLGALRPIISRPPPYQLENVHPALAYLQAAHRPGDRMFVFYAGVLAFDFYGPSYGFGRSDYLAGACHRPEPRSMLEEVDTLRGAPRVWIFFAHAAGLSLDRDDLVGYLDAIGRRLDRFPVPIAGYTPEVEVLLYDLSDQTRLASVDAAHYPIRGPMSTTRSRVSLCGRGESLLQPRAPRLAP